MDCPIIIATPEYEKFADYVELCDKEVAAFGYVEPFTNCMYVHELFLVPQTVSGSSVDFMEEGLPYAVEKAKAENRLEELRFCVHSHVNMSTFWSATDASMIRAMDNGIIPWFVSAVFNKKGETAGRIDIFSIDGLPAITPFHFDVDVTWEARAVAQAERQAELDQFLTVRSWTNKKNEDWYKGDKDKKDEDKPWYLKGKDESSTDIQAWGMTWRDEELHKDAIKNEWEHHFADGMAYYWDEKGQDFKGSAPLPNDNIETMQELIDYFVSAEIETLSEDEIQVLEAMTGEIH